MVPAAEIDPLHLPDQMTESFFKRSISIFRELKAENEMAMTMKGYGWLCKSQNNDSLAHDFFQQALKIFNRLGTKFDENEIRKALEPTLDFFNE